MTQSISDGPAVEVSPPRSVRLTGKLRRVAPVAATVGVSFGIVALQLVQGILLARLLGPQGRGEYAASMLYVQLLLYVGLFGAIEVICRYATSARVDASSLRHAAFKLSLATSAMTIAVVLLCNLLGLPKEKQYLLPLATVCSLSVLGQHIQLILSAVDRGRDDFARYNKLRLIAAAAFPLLVIGYSLFADVTVWAACVIMAVAPLLSAAFCFRWSTPARGLDQPPTTFQLLKEGRPYAMSMLATDLLERLDLLLILWLTPLVTQGYYNAMIPVAYPLTVIPNTLGLYLFNAGAQDGRSLTSRQAWQMFGYLAALQSVMTLGFWICVGPVVRVVYGEEFVPAVTFAMWLAPVAAIKGISQGIESYVKGRGRPMAAVRVRLMSAVVMLLAIAVIYPFTGVYAIVQGSLISQLVCLLGLALIVHNDIQDRALVEPLVSV